MGYLDEVVGETKTGPFSRDALRRLQGAFAEFVADPRRAGDHESIIAMFERFEDSLLNDFLEPAVLNRLGESLLAKYRFTDCQLLFDRRFVANGFPELARLYSAMCAAYDDPDSEARYALADLAAKLSDPDLRARALLAAGDAKRDAGHDAAALALYRRGLSGSPGADWASRLNVRIGDLELERGHAAAARTQYGLAESAKPARPELGFAANVAFGLAETAYQLKRYDEAAGRFRQFADDHADDPRRLLVRVRVAQSMVFDGKSLDDAVAYLDVANERDPRVVPVLEAVAQDLSWWKRYGVGKEASFAAVR
jgi:predicted negative regulator of RcsB-dependent stress response